MNRKSLTPLGQTEMEVLHIVWELESASVNQVRERILEDRKVAYTTVMTILKNLADKGYLTYENVNNTYVYRALENPSLVRGKVLQGILEKVFLGSKTELIQSLVQQEEIDDEELQQIQEMINQLKKK
jgi:predicted transcriptional regulator